MDIEQIGKKYQQLNDELKKALSSMERSDKVFIIHNMMEDLQHECPHNNGNFDFSTTERCPYCGTRFRR